MRLGFGALGGYTALKNYEKSIVTGELTGHLASPVKYGSIQFEGDKTGLAFLKATQKTKYLKSDIKLYGNVIQKEGGEVFVSSGKGVVEVKGNLWNYLGGRGPLKVHSIQKIDLVSKSFPLPKPYEKYIISMEAVKPTTGSALFYQPSEKGALWTGTIGGKPTTDFFLSTSKQIPSDIYGHKQFFGSGGKLMKHKGDWFVQLSHKQTGITKVIKTEDLWKSDEGILRVTKLKDYGKLRGFKIDSKVYGSGGGKMKTSLEKTFESKAESALEAYGERGLESSSKMFKEILKPSKKTFMGTGGLGLGTRQKTIYQQKGGVSFKALSLTSKSDLDYKSKLKPLSRTSSISKSKSKSGYKFISSPILKTPSISKSKYSQSLTSSLKLRQPLKQKYKQSYRFAFPSSISMPSLKLPWGAPSIPLPIIIPLPSIKGARGKKKKKGKKPTRKTKYLPTLASVEYGITSPEISKAYKMGAGGIISRPRIKRRKKKRKGGKK